MSNSVTPPRAITYDALLVHHLARELDARLRGGRIRRLRIERDARRATIELDDDALIWRLHPLDGRLGFAAPTADPIALEWRSGSSVAGVTAPPDERILFIDVRTRGRDDAPARIAVELMTNQWNLFVLDRAGRIRVALRRPRAGRRSLGHGDVYATPAPLSRQGSDETLGEAEWHALLDDVAPEDRTAAIVRHVAWTSPMNAAALFTAPDSPDAPTLASAFLRYRAMVPPAPPRPVLLHLEAARQPYPFPLQGVEATEAASLLDAFAALGRDVAASADVTASALAPELLDRLARVIESKARRIASLRAELAGAGPEAARLRRGADLLLAQPHVAPKGTRVAALDDFEGGALDVELDPALDAFGNANAIHDAAKRRERASERLPRLIDRETQALASLHELRVRAEGGEADAAEIERAAPARTAKPGAGEPRLPYRRYSTSSGLEVRVGRGRHANDELTFHHSSPDDAWLHARDVAGAHVILRWGRKDANPPHRDLVEAAAFAARHSKARTSATVAVDWTLRKYVRKPRKAPPGAVVPDRVKTLFVEL